jgi:hypothetical protein
LRSSRSISAIVAVFDVATIDDQAGVLGQATWYAC